MTKEQADKNKRSLGNRMRDAMKGMLDRIREEADAVAGMMLPNRQRVLQPIPVPVRTPGRRR